MNEFLLAVVVVLLLGMIVMMFKYAKYIHSLPKSQIKTKTDEPPGSDSPDKEDKGQ